MRYNNYHKHDHKGNAKSLDTITKEIDYVKRCKELGHTNYFTTNHGSKGDVYTSKTLCDEYGLKMIVGAEFYYVNDIEVKERKMYHLVVIALNNNGYRQINKALSYANVKGTYYKPRIDKKILFEFNPNDVIITTACVVGIANIDNSIELLTELKDYFKEHLFLEVQNHVHISQKKHNEKILMLNKKLNIPLIHANDSHYIYENDNIYRDMFLKGKGIEYPEETGFILDFPDTKTIIERYREQGVLSEEQIIESIKNTLIFDKAEDITIINDDIKLPSISKDPKMELKTIIFENWEKEKKNIPEELHEKYMNEIRYEYNMIDKCHMDDYFIIDYHIVKRAENVYNGILTNTGRGSAVSYYINKLLGLTDIDRISSPITLYPTRFMSDERILSAKSLPDIDLNMIDQEPFIKATEDILGKENCAWMISYKLLQDASAFRLWCKAKGMHVSEYDDVAKDLDKYRENAEWKDLIEESKRFVGVVESISPSPCSMLLYDKPVNEEIGLINIKGVICCDLDGYNCDKYKYLKNDYLQVKVYKIISDTCKLAGIQIPTIRELTENLNQKTFDIYKNKLTCTVNQVDSQFATDLASKYGISSVEEMSAFVAAIRPGFASLLDNFIQRKPYSNGVAELDGLLKESFCYMMYQESIMKYLIWLGIKESESYDILKKIAKKKFKQDELDELHGKLKKGWMNQVGTMEGFEKTWEVVNDMSKYGFNASHSLSYAYDSLYCAYLKANYPIEYYTAALNLYDGDIERTPRLVNEMEHFDLHIRDPKFRYSKAEYFMDKETNSIYKGIESIKFLNADVADYLYSLRENTYYSFSELLFDIKGHINARQLDILIKIGFFEEFGKTEKLIKVVDAFNTITTKKTFKYDNEYIDYILPYAAKVSEKQVKEIDYNKVMESIESSIEDQDIPIGQRIQAHIENMGNCTLKDESVDMKVCVVTNVDTKYSPKVTLYCIATGKTSTLKISKPIFRDNKLEIFDTIVIEKIVSKPKKKLIDGKWTKSATESEIWLETYLKIN